MSIPGYSMALLRACGANNEQLLQVLAPIGGRLPTTEDDLQRMQAYLRRMGHILEAFPNNIAQTLGQRTPHNTPTFFGTDGNTQQQQQWPQQPSGFEGMGGVGTPYPASHQGGWNMGGVGTQPPAYPSVEFDSETDSDTSSDNWFDPVPNPFLALPENEQEQQIYWQYAQARRLWRRFSQKPNRRVRRFVRRKGGKGGKGSSTFMANFTGVIGKGGKGKTMGTSGKGHFGRRKNPKGRDGQVMKCSICNSDEHLRAVCPQRSNSQPQALGYAIEHGPIAT